MAVEIDLLNLERAITGLTGVVRESTEQGASMCDSLQRIASALEGEDLNYLESIALSLEQIALSAAAQSQHRRKSRARKKTSHLKVAGS